MARSLDARGGGKVAKLAHVLLTVVNGLLVCILHIPRAAALVTTASGVCKGSAGKEVDGKASQQRACGKRGAKDKGFTGDKTGDKRLRVVLLMLMMTMMMLLLQLMLVGQC
jgi:hypothetical protein